MPDAFPFIEAVRDLARKKLLPTNLGSRELAQLDAGLKRQSIFSARTTVEDYLQDIKDTVEDVINPQQVDRGGGLTVTEGMNPATAREFLRDQLKTQYGYSPEEDEAGTIKDLSSDARLNLVVKTNVELAQGAGRFIQTND